MVLEVILRMNNVSVIADGEIYNTHTHRKYTHREYTYRILMQPLSLTSILPQGSSCSVTKYSSAYTSFKQQGGIARYCSVFNNPTVEDAPPMTHYSYAKY